VTLEASSAPPLEAVQTALLAGDLHRARVALDEAQPSAGDDPLFQYVRAAALLAAGEAKAGAAALDLARRLHALQMVRASGGDVQRLAADPEYAFEVGRQFYNAKQMAPAAVAFAHAAATSSPLMARAMQLHGEALHYEGRVDEASTAFAAALALDPGPQRHSLYVYSLFFVADGTRRHAEEARRWSRLWADQTTPPLPRFAVMQRSDRRLRIGYVAPSFTTNQTRQFFQPLLAAHDPDAVDVFLYVEAAEDESAPGHVGLRSTRGIEPAAIAEQIRHDRIDVLVDVWGHAARNILPAFALKPAPVQVGWLNYIQTVGMPAIDAVLHGDFMDAPGKTETFTEEIWGLGPVTGLYQPDPGARPSPPPALARGYVTFASFNHPAKLSAATLSAWAQILRACPTARLTLKYAPFCDSVLQAQMQARFLGHGVDPGRLEFEGHSQGEEYEAAFAQVDLALDPSPCPAGTTTLEAFSRGVPVLTLDGEDFFARIGVQPMMALGLPEMIAASWDDYVEKAVGLAHDLPRLARLRAEIRPRFDASAYRDAPAFARRLEGVYRRLFERWLTRQSGATELAA
jgi:protein O-GlcNAc transferase